MDFRKKIKFFVKNGQSALILILNLSLILLIESFSGEKKHTKMELLINLIFKKRQKK